MSEPKARYDASPPARDPPIFKVYTKTFNAMGKSEVHKETSTTTCSLVAALAAFVDLRKDPHLEGTETHLVLSRNNRHLLYHRFDVDPDNKDFVDPAGIHIESQICESFLVAHQDLLQAMLQK